MLLFEPGEQVDLPMLLERGTGAFIAAGMDPSQVIMIVANFIGYSIGNGSANANQLKSGKDTVIKHLSETADEVFLQRAGAANPAGTA